MAVLSDRSIAKALEDDRLVIDPRPEDHRIQPASVDLLLGQTFVRYPTYHFDHIEDPYHRPVIDLQAIGMMTETGMFGIGDSVRLEPREFILGTTLERVTLPNNLVARIEGKSSLGRLGLLTHCTAGFIDPGFDGTITLELYNLNPSPIILRPGLPICQLAIMNMDAPVERPYGHEELSSKYQGQTTTTASRYAG
jgi:dCTP deaminase